MIGYAAEEVFSQRHTLMWRHATELIHGLEEKPGGLWRCHEVARALFQFIDQSDARIVDGQCGLVEHSWIELDQETILDVYTVGRLPMVQLIHVSWASLIKTPLGPAQLYVEGQTPREDIDFGHVETIKNRLRQIDTWHLFR